MELLKWNRDLNIGVDVIDKQHQHIGDCINRLQQAIEDNNKGAIEVSFDEIIDYTVTHFGFEEDLQIKAGYEFCTAHKRAHLLFVKRIGVFKQQFDDTKDEESIEVGQELLLMLRRWIINHIQQEENYSDFVLTRMKENTTDGESKGWVSRLFS
jgi:hemerythrin